MKKTHLNRVPKGDRRGSIQMRSKAVILLWVFG